jgi:putative DNA primase/helicase
MSSLKRDNARADGAASGEKSNLLCISYGDYTFTPLPVIPSNIPAVLHSHCCVWRAEFDTQDGKPKLKDNGKPYIKKAPLTPRGGYNISVNKPETWATIGECLAALDTGKFSGVGILMQSDMKLVGIDLDSINALKNRHPELELVLARVRRDGLYAERSPSNTGARIFVRASLPKDGIKGKGIELYAHARHLTVTGQTLWPGNIKEAQWLVDELLKLTGDTAVVTPGINAAGTSSVRMVVELQAWAAENHSLLWEGHWDAPPGPFGGPEYPSQSEADYALLGYITREGVKRGITDPDVLSATVIDVFQHSGLYRPEKHTQVERYAVGKLVAATLEEIKPVVGSPQAVVEFASAEPGDIIAGRLFASRNHDRLHFVGQAGRWLQWDGTRWLWCACGEEMANAKHVAEATLIHAAKLFSQDNAKHHKRMAFATRLQNLPRLEAMIELAKSEPGMTVGHVAELDSDPWLIGARNGVVNLKDGTLLTPSPAMLITRQVAAKYDRGSECPRWGKFLDQLFEGDQETVGFIQRAIGYTLTGTTTEEVLFICYGGGANGKSVFANVISEIMADYGQMAPPSLLTTRKDGDAGPRNDVARLCGARLVQINELNQGDRLDEQVVKMLAGREMLSARFLHKEFFDFKPTAKPWLRTNHRPVVTGEDDGIWRRIMLIPFKRKFSESERDPWLEQKLLEERDGILAWMVEGCLGWKRHGLNPSALIRRESAAYRTESDLLGEFLDERFDSDPNGKVEQGDAFSKWRQWAEANGVRAGSKKSFTRKLEERGFTEARSNGKRYYAGLILKPM